MRVFLSCDKSISCTLQSRSNADIVEKHGCILLKKKLYQFILIGNPISVYVVCLILAISTFSVVETYFEIFIMASRKIEMSLKVCFSVYVLSSVA